MPLERGLDAAIETFDTPRLEEDGARLDRLDREARVFEPAEDSLPLLLDGSRVGLHEHELGARRERLPQPQARTHACRLCRRGHRADQLLLSGHR